MNLYWVETDDHHEDWFVVAPTKRSAEKFHVDAEGYGDEDARAVLVVALPAGVDCMRGWPSNAELEAWGGEFVRRETPRVVKIGGRLFSEGMLEHEISQRMDDVFEARGDGRRNRTEPRRRA